MSFPSAHRPCEVIEETGRELCIQAFAAAGGDYREIARILGLHCKSIHRLIRRHGLGHLFGEL